MSSRVRYIGSHINYGNVSGGIVVYYIHHSWKAKFPRKDLYVLPPMYKKWPHWKRVIWMAKQEGGWMIKVFREPRGAKLSRSLYGKTLGEFGIAVKYKIKAKPPIVKKPYVEIPRAQDWMFNVPGLNAGHVAQPQAPRIQQPPRYNINNYLDDIVRDGAGILPIDPERG